ncbi:hypothetical protein D030_0733B, partial [Vibrio parahaemolyticus AQ3810]
IKLASQLSSRKRT